MLWTWIWTVGGILSIHVQHDVECGRACRAGHGFCCYCWSYYCHCFTVVPAATASVVTASTAAIPATAAGPEWCPRGYHPRHPRRLEESYTQGNS